MKYSCLLFSCLFLVVFNSGHAQKKGAKQPVKSDRAIWLSKMDEMVAPVLSSVAADSLRINMPKVTSQRVDNRESRIKVQYLEVFGRVLSGIAPWIQLEGGNPEEVRLRQKYRIWVIKGLRNSLDSTAKDFMRYDLNGQQLVDASFIAIAVIRAPWIWENLGGKYQDLLVKSIRTTRMFKPGFSNWLLFSAVNEAFLAKYNNQWDVMRVDYALQQMEQWYVGDGLYKDGSSFAFDYYNSFVIHPYLSTLSDVIGSRTTDYKDMFAKIAKRNERYAVIQERLIHTDGTFPVLGRSIIYRGAVFHHLANMALGKKLPAELKPEQVRCGLTAVILKTLESRSTYQQGWLSLGLYGSQPDIADVYNNQGSPYLATAIFLPLGLPDSDPFWANPPAKWSAQRIWSGEDFPNDHASSLK
ncbi:MAG: DUF2264 domain-containing protein [Bacteroidota bacterium]